LIPVSEQNELVRLLSGCPRRLLRVGDVCCAADFCEVRLLIVARGILVLSSASTARRRIVLAFCSHGALLPPPGRDEQLRALADSVLIVLTADHQRSLLRLPAASGAIVDALMEAVSQRQESLAQFANVAHSERLRAKLLQLARAHGTVLADGSRLELPLTHELLG
jgi:CRP-like cAMP-binding protein